jgi:hypothetical protein
MAKKVFYLVLVFFAFSLLSSCSGDESDSTVYVFDGTDPKTDEFSDFLMVRNFDNDNRFIVRDRLDIAVSENHTVEMLEQPFSHRSKRWQVFPFTSYGKSTVNISVQANDSKMDSSTVLWIYGPRLDDGSWKEIRVVESSYGKANLKIETSGFGQYAIVVGPQGRSKFLPRYPANRALFEYGDENNPDEYEGDAWIVTESEEDVYIQFEDGTRYKIKDPIYGRTEEFSPDETIYASIPGKDNSDMLFYPLAWQRSTWLVAKEGDNTWQLGYLHQPYEGCLELWNEGGSQEYLMLDAIGAEGNYDTEDPYLLRLVPRKWEGRELELVEDPNCDTAEHENCWMVQDLDEVEVDDYDIFEFRSLFIDFDEPSTYNIKVKCEGDCAPQTTGPTKYPIYFAHGFNSEKETWAPLLEYLREQNPEFANWTWAADVPGFEPVANRAEQLRRNLETYLANLSDKGVGPAAGESYIRLNIFGHSMGGLDSRYLTGHEKYNSADCHQNNACTDAEGNPESCCSTDANGNPVPWKNRIASITSLSTPHEGSSFADWGVDTLEKGLVDKAFRLVVKKFMGLDTKEQQNEVKECLYNLSKAFAADVMAPTFPPHANRNYYWDCAIGKKNCRSDAIPTNSDLPIADYGQKDGFLLPPPDDVTTLFAWSSNACISGTCGSVVDPALMLPFRIVKKREGKNDGVVAIDAAKFGIYMGNRANDHFHWSRFKFSGVSKLTMKLFGVKQEPLGLFYVHWIDKLSRSGY